MEDKKASTKSRYRNLLHQFLVQLFCKHKYKLVDETEVFPDPEPGEIIIFSRSHVCKRCEKGTILGSGLIAG